MVSFPMVLVRIFVAVKRQHDYGNSNEGTHTVGVAYIFRGLVHCLHGATSGCAGRHGARGGAESTTSGPAGYRKWSELGIAWA